MVEAGNAGGWPRFRRRKVLIHPGYQLRVAATILGFIVAYSLLLGFLLFYPLYLEFAGKATPEEQLWIAREVIDLHSRFWPSVLAVGILAAAQSIFVTHRTVGPAYQIRRVMEGLAAGRYEMRARIRRWDRLKELEIAVNALGDALQQRESARGGQVQRLRAAVAALQSGASGLALPPALQQRLAEIERIAADLSEKG